MKWIIAAAAIVVVAFIVFAGSQRVRDMMADSETILWARLQMLLGLGAGALVYVDPGILAGILPAGWLPWVVLANGVATEFLRRSRAEDL